MKKILLADDSITIQKVVELTFSDSDYEVMCVSNGAQALKRLPEFAPDLVLLDVVMPEKNGYEVCEQIRRDPATARIPVLLLTGTFEPFDQRQAEAAGASGHLTKPFESHALVALVEEMLSQPAAPSAPEETHPSEPVPAALPADGPAAALGSATPAKEAAWPGEIPPAPHPGERQTLEEPGPQIPPPVPPDPTDGGSHRASDHLSFGEPGVEILQDRFDEADSGTTTTLRISADELKESRKTSRPTPSGDEAVLTPQPMEGFVAGYGFPEADAPAGPGEHPVIPVPPAPQEEMAPPPGAARDVAPHEPAPAGVPQSHASPPAPATLCAEDIDRVAEQVVKQISDRVVREIAWEVIPRVAEQLVRSRIRELEEQGDD